MTIRTTNSPSASIDIPKSDDVRESPQPTAARNSAQVVPSSPIAASRQSPPPPSARDVNFRTRIERQNQTAQAAIPTELAMYEELLKLDELPHDANAVRDLSEAEMDDIIRLFDSASESPASSQRYRTLLPRPSHITLPPPPLFNMVEDASSHFTLPPHNLFDTSIDRFYFSNLPPQGFINTFEQPPSPSIPLPIQTLIDLGVHGPRSSLQHGIQPSERHDLSSTERVFAEFLRDFASPPNPDQTGAEILNLTTQPAIPIHDYIGPDWIKRARPDDEHESHAPALKRRLTQSAPSSPTYMSPHLPYRHSARDRNVRAQIESPRQQAKPINFAPPPQPQAVNDWQSDFHGRIGISERELEDVNRLLDANVEANAQSRSQPWRPAPSPLMGHTASAYDPFGPPPIPGLAGVNMHAPHFPQPQDFRLSQHHLSSQMGYSHATWPEPIRTDPALFKLTARSPTPMNDYFVQNDLVAGDTTAAGPPPELSADALQRFEAMLKTAQHEARVAMGYTTSPNVEHGQYGQASHAGPVEQSAHSPQSAKQVKTEAQINAPIEDVDRSVVKAEPSRHEQNE